MSRRKVTVDLSQIEEAMEAPEGVPPGLFDPRTGEVTWPEPDEWAADDDPGDLEEIPRLESSEEYEWMRAFVDALSDGPERDRLHVGLDGKGAFGRFRNVLQADADLEAAWYARRAEALRALARDWVEGLGIDVEDTSLWSAAAPIPAPAPAKKPRHVGLVELLVLGAPDGKTELIDGLIRRVFVANDELDAKRVFATVARDLCRLSEFPWRRRFGENPRFAVPGLTLERNGARIELDVEASIDVWRRFG